MKLFAKILNGTISCYKILEDEVSLAFLDVMPRAKGHVLVIPKSPARNLLDASPNFLAELIVRVQRVAKAAKEALECDGITLQQFSEPAGGQEIFHLHFHVLPRWKDIPLISSPAPRAREAELIEIAKKITARMSE